MRLVVLAIVGACSSPAPKPTTNVVLPPTPVALPTDAELGWLGFATAKRRDSWIPAGTGVVVPGKKLEVGPGVTLLHGVDPAGATAELVFSDTESLDYGCDNNKLDVTVLAHTGGAEPQPGVVFLRDAKKSKPEAIAITARAAVNLRIYSAGVITVEVSARDRTHGALAITWNGREVYRKPFERVTMTGAPDNPIDVRGDGVAVPVLEAGWSVGSASVFVFRIAGYEGMNFETVVVNATASRVVETMGTYLYHCAF